jgi:hypothetical protein
MKTITLIFFLLTSMASFGQEWIIIDILEQSRKELIYRIDDGESVKRETVKDPSIVRLIKEFQEQGFVLKSVTQGVELDLNGNLPLINSRNNNNIGITNLTLSNNNRIMLWFVKNREQSVEIP